LKSPMPKTFVPGKPGARDFLLLSGVLLIHLAWALVELLKGPWLVGHSKGFIAHNFAVPFGYPLFLDAVKLFFHNHSLNVTAGIQVVWVAGLAFYFSFWAKKLFNLGWAGFLAVDLVALLPFWDDLGLWIIPDAAARDITPEPLAYGFVLVAAVGMAAWIIKKSLPHLLAAMACSCLAFAVLPQYVFLVFFSLLLVVLRARRIGLFRQTLFPALFLLCCLAGVSLADRAYHLAAYKTFAPGLGGGVQRVTPLLYLMDPTDTTSAADKQERFFLQLLYEELSKERLLKIYNKPDKLTSFAFHYRNAYYRIQKKVLPQVFARVFRQGITAWETKESSDLTYQEYVRLNDLTKQMAKPLALAHIKDVLWLFGQECFAGHGLNQYLLVLIWGPWVLCGWLCIKTPTPRYKALFCLLSLHPAACVFAFWAGPLSAAALFNSFNLACASLVVFLASGQGENPCSRLGAEGGTS